MARGPLPGNLARIAEVAGVPAAMALAERLGGTAVYVARRPRVGTKLVDAVGPTAARAIAEEFGGETIEIASAKTHVAAYLLDAGVGAQDIARRLKIDRNTVSRIRKKLQDDARQGSLFDAL